MRPEGTSLQAQKQSLNLKTLDLDQWICGRIRAGTGFRCSLKIVKANRDQINSLVNTLSTLRKSSPQIPIQLEALAKLTHCSSHGVEGLKDVRSAVWLGLLMREDSEHSAHSVESVQEQIKEVFGPISRHCSCKTPEQCGKRIGGQKVRNIRKTIDEIIRPEVYMNDTNLGYLLQVLEANIYCPMHEEEVNQTKSIYWKMKILEIRSVHISNPVKVLENDEELVIGRLQSQVSVITLTEPHSPSDNEASISIAISTESSPGSVYVTKDPATFWPAAFESSPFQFLNKPARYRQRHSLDGPLNGREKKPGYIYILQEENNAGYLKIGYTTDSIEKRCQNWTFYCNRKFKLVYPTSSELTTQVSYAERVEAWCHHKLHYCRKTIYCNLCLGEHTEWFQTSIKEAIGVIESQSELMAAHHHLYDPESPILKAQEGTTFHEVEDIADRLAATVI
ncbi:DUF1766-domain-containing protein [Penicillium malachiteum]|uniref:DUF1766-domain-containing protein n=1 Tax=Penicillium malachiteum TaxID=1324776 RepID=UPI00254840D3|nr:DUF1766-domain-containing protein [Penicillium malachiteum]KAJ5720863.1 DUF1766-domain-containing protein [Penicillium malachiteum]